MSDEVLEAYISKYIATQHVPEISFVWQGGEPALAGLTFYEKAVKLQKKYGKDKRITNSFQTNGTLLDETWMEFFKDNHFLIGLSMDGPAPIHDKYRVDRKGAGTCEKVSRALDLLEEYGIEYNSLICVSRESCQDGAEIYRFLKSKGVKHMQFTSLIERLPDKKALALGLHYAMPDELRSIGEKAVTDFSVEPAPYGAFLIDVFDEWMKEDVGQIFIRNIEDILPVWAGRPPAMCIYGQTCGGCMIVEHNGDIYSCDHFMSPQYKIGNILDDDPSLLAESKLQRDFGLRKKEFLPPACKYCDVNAVCGGGCKKHRFIYGKSDEFPHHYLCKAYKKYYHHISPYMKAIVKLIQNDLPASKVMELKNGPIVVLKAKK